ncbi:hypothetical protein AUF12_11745 [Enterococcus avium]|nr:hypothetical protein AUF12_11745 [Enterococcus avium]
MKWIHRIKQNVFFYLGILIVILNVVFLNYNFLISLVGTALVFFSDTLAKSINNYLVGNH